MKPPSELIEIVDELLIMNEEKLLRENVQRLPMTIDELLQNILNEIAKPFVKEAEANKEMQGEKGHFVK